MIARKLLAAVCVCLLLASVSDAGESVLGTSGNETRIFGSGTHRILTSSGFQGGLQSAGTYTYASGSDCIDLVSSTDLSTTVSCTGGVHQIRRTPRDITFTRLTLVQSTAIGGSSDFGCKARLFLNGTAYADSEVVLTGEMASGTVATASFSHRVPAGSQWGIQFANADGCSSSGSCSCGVASGGETVLPFVYGVEH